MMWGNRESERLSTVPKAAPIVPTTTTTTTTTRDEEEGDSRSQHVAVRISAAASGEKV